MTAETKVKPIEHAILRITTDKKPETVNQPIEFLKQTTTASKNEILNTIIKLQN